MIQFLQCYKCIHKKKSMQETPCNSCKGLGVLYQPKKITIHQAFNSLAREYQSRNKKLINTTKTTEYDFNG